jgi:hypothetical protein
MNIWGTPEVVLEEGNGILDIDLVWLPRQSTMSFDRRQTEVLRV